MRVIQRQWHDRAACSVAGWTGSHPLEFMPCLARSTADGEIEKITLGHPLLDDYLVFVAARGRINTWLAVAYDLKVFFEVVGKEPAVVTAADVFAFLSAQRAPRCGERVVRLEDGEAGLAARTFARRLSSVRGLYGYLCAREDTGVRRNPVPGSLAARSGGKSEIRILFVFDPWRSAILLVAGDKAGQWNRWYAEAIPRAEQLYEIYLKERAEEESGR